MAHKFHAAICYLAIALVSGASGAFAMDGSFDRSADVDKFIETINTAPQVTATAALRDIYWSGISDRRLGEFLKERLLSDYAEIGTPEYNAPVPRFSWTVDEKYGVALIEALASLGLPDYNSAFEVIEQRGAKGKNKTVNKRMRTAARSAPRIVTLHTGLNAVMASRENHVEGSNSTASMLINLVKTDNRIYRDFALDRVYRQKLYDPRLLDVLEAQVLEYVNQSPIAKLEWQHVFVRRNIKLLGLSGNIKYRKTMEVVLASNADAGAKKHAAVAASLLQGP